MIPAETELPDETELSQVVIPTETVIPAETEIPDETELSQVETQWYKAVCCLQPQINPITCLPDRMPVNAFF